MGADRYQTSRKRTHRRKIRRVVDPKGKKEIQFSIRAEEVLIEAVDDEVKVVKRQTPGLTYSRASLIREALFREVNRRRALRGEPPLEPPEG